MNELEDWSAEERAALQAWDTVDAPPGFTRAVTSRIDAEIPTAARRRRKVMIAGAGAVLVSALVVASSIGGRAREVEGQVRAIQRTEIEMGQRGVVVAEAGAHLRYRVSAEGEAEVHQIAGDVFYRVDPGGPFVVRTPGGEVRVTGTCFRVEVRKMNAKKSGFTGAVAGAAVATLVWVTIYEGRVVASGAGESATLRAGESAVLEAGRAPARTTEPRGGPAVGSPSPADAAATDEPEMAMADVPAAVRARWQALLQENAGLRARRAQMQSELARVQAALSEAKAEADADGILDLAPEVLDEMADQCELRWDVMALGPEPSTMPTKRMDALDITPAEKAVADDVFAEHHLELTKAIRQIYTEVTGDPDTGSLATTAMINEINDKVTEPALRAAFARLSAERAGRPLPPSNPSEEAPALRLYRLLTGSGDRLEQMLANRLGPETAAAYRRIEDGWDSKSRSSYGCPGEPD